MWKALNYIDSNVKLGPSKYKIHPNNCGILQTVMCAGLHHLWRVRQGCTERQSEPQNSNPHHQNETRCHNSGSPPCCPWLVWRRCHPHRTTADRIKGQQSQPYPGFQVTTWQWWGCNSSTTDLSVCWNFFHVGSQGVIQFTSTQIITDTLCSRHLLSW